MKIHWLAILLKSEFLQEPTNKRIRLKYSSLITESLRYIANMACPTLDFVF